MVRIGISGIQRFIVFLALMFLFPATFVVFIPEVDALGPSNGGYIFDIEKVIYSPGDTVFVKVTNTYLDQPKAKVTIRNGMGSENYENAQIYFQEEKQLDNGTVIFMYRIPNSDIFQFENIYRYYVEATGIDLGGGQTKIGSAFFFTNTEASKIVISDLVADENESKPGGVLTFNAKVTDGLGKPLPSTARIEGRIAFPSEDCNMDYSGMSDNISPNAKGMDYLNQYKSSGKIYGWINVIPELYPGDYYLHIVASGDENKGFQYAEQRLKVHVSGNASDVNVIDVFKMELRSSDPEVRLSNGNHEATIPSGKNATLSLDGFSAINICGSILSDYPLSFRLVRSDPLIAPNPDQPTILNYSMTTDSSGNFVIPINVTGFLPGNYKLLVDMTYEGVNYERGSSIQIHDVKTYLVHEEGQDFVVNVDAGFSTLQKFDFNKEEKRISILLTSGNYSHNTVEIDIPYGLLSGNFTVLLNGRERTNDNSWFSYYGPNSTGFSILSYGEDIDKIDFVGTYVVPEFGSSIFIWGIAMFIALSSIAATRYLDLFSRFRWSS